MELSVKQSTNLFQYRHSWFHLFRPLTFTGTIAPATAGAILAFSYGSFNFIWFIVFLIAILLVQAAINMLNDYYDFKRGQDFDKWVQPFESGISHGPCHASLPKVAGGMLLAASLIGLWLGMMTTPWIILIGIAGITAGWLYSGGPRPLSSIALGEAIAFLFMGPAPLFVSLLIQGHLIRLEALLISLPFALMISTMIMTNNIRDIKKDRGHRVTIPILLGKNNAVKLLSLLLAIGYVSMIGIVWKGLLPWTVIFSLLALPLAAKLIHSFRSSASRSEELAAMKVAAIHHWTFSIIFLIGYVGGL